MDGARTCPYCAEDIRAEATRCPHCRSHLPAPEPERWRRDRPERRLGGVAAALGHALGFPVGAVRVAFLALTFFHLLGPLAYGTLWVILPFSPGEASPLERGLDRAREFVARLKGQNPPVPGGPLA